MRPHRAEHFANAHDAMAFLGLSPSDNAQQLRSRYRQLAFENHPDRNPDDKESFERFKRVREAYLLVRRQYTNGQDAFSRCAMCGRRTTLRIGVDRRQCCRSCLLRGRRWRTLPAPPTIVVSCAFAIVAMIVAVVCLVMRLATGSQTSGWTALIASGSMLIFLAIISIRVGYVTTTARNSRN